MTRRDFAGLAAIPAAPLERVRLTAIAGPRLPDETTVTLAAPPSAVIFERRRRSGDETWLLFESLAKREEAWDEIARLGGDPAIGEFTLFRRT